MNEKLTYLPDSLHRLLNQYFSLKVITTVKGIFNQSEVSLSFTKGSPKTYFIVSGIVLYRRLTFETRLSYRNEEGSNPPKGELKSLCTCGHWTEADHCEHVGLLFIKYFLIHFFNQIPTTSTSSQDFKTSPIQEKIAAIPKAFGTLIEHPREFGESFQSTPFSALFFKLLNHSIIHFPKPKNFEGHLNLNFFIPPEGPSPDSSSRPLLFSFSHSLADDQQGQEVYCISLLGSHYIFHWSHGVAYEMPAPLHAFFEKIKNEYKNYKINDFLFITQELRELSLLQIFINDKKVEDYPSLTPQCHLIVRPSLRKNHFTLGLYFTDDFAVMMPLPAYFKLFTNGGGLDHYLINKSLIFSFSSSLLDYFHEGNEAYKTDLRQSSLPQTMLELIEKVPQINDFTIFDEFNSSLCLYNKKLLNHLVSSLLGCFGKYILRYSNFDEQSRNISYDIPTQKLFKGIYAFCKTMEEWNIPVYFKEKKISYWSPKLTLQRKETGINWFDLDLALDQRELDFVNNFNFEHNFSFNNDELILLADHQKDLIKFINKYTKYESSKDKSQKNTDGLTHFQLSLSKNRIFEIFELKKLGLQNLLSPEEDDICTQLMKLESLPEYPLSSYFSGEARSYQVMGYRWLRFLFEHRLGGCLADDMGLGKTVQTIMFLSSIYDRIKKVLIICPVSIVINWKHEFEKFSNLQVELYYGNKRQFNPEAKIIITSYGIMKKEIGTTFKEQAFDILILDEAQSLKNIKSIGAKAVRKIKADFHLCLTGTPVENNIAEFYNILDISVPGIWGSPHFFKSLTQEKDTLMVKRIAKPFILRRSKENVLTDLPDKIENQVFLSFSDEERSIYEKTLREIRGSVFGSQEKNYTHILHGLLQLRRLCLWQSGHQKKLFDIPSSTKIDFLLKTLEQVIEEGHKAIIFSQFTTYLDLIEKRVEEKNWSYSRLDGSQNLKKRQENIDQFQSDEKNQIFLISLKAGGLGLNLTQASYVFLMDPWWNPAVEAQAVDRAYRIGQKNKLTIYKIYIESTIEEKILNLQKIKKQLFTDLLSEETNFYSGKLTMEDFKYLFS